MTTDNTNGMTEAELKEFSDLASAGVAEARFGDRSVRMQPLSEIRKQNDATMNAGKRRTHRAVFSKGIHRSD